MDAVFLKSKELNWEENFEQAKIILPKIKLIDGSAATSIKNAYEIMLSKINADFFIMIEGDNFLYHQITHHIEAKPIKFHAENKYGFAYEHGAVKIMRKTEVEQQLKTNSHIHDNYEVSANLFLNSIPVIVSSHNFDFSRRNEWITISKELIKLYFWNHKDYLNRWLAHETPALIFEHCLEILQDISLTQLFEDLMPNLGKIYDTRYKERFECS